MPDTYTWVTVSVTELCLNHLGSVMSFTHEGMSLEGRLTGLAGYSHDGHNHLNVFVRTGSETGVQLEFDGTESVRLSLEKVE